MKKILIKGLILYTLVLGATNLSAQYCTTNVGAAFDFDSNVETLTLMGDAGTSLNYTGCSGPIGNIGVVGLDNQIAQSVNVTAGNSYTANIQFGTCGSNFLGAGEAWIDWNQNNTFDPSESIGTWSGTPPVAISAFNFTVPTSAFNGVTRMRVVQEEDGILPLDPCASFTYGSTTDFTIVVFGGAVFTCPFPSTLTATNITATSANLGWTENGAATSWQIEYGTQGFTPGIGTTVIATTNPFNLTGLMPSSNYDYYVRAICAAGDSSSWVGPFNFQTACGPIMAPWTESFGTNSLPTCWTDNGNDPYIFNTSPDWGAAGTLDYTSGGGTNYAWVDGSSTANTFDTLTSPEINISGLATPHLCFALFSNNVDDPGNNTIMIQFYDGATWNNLSTFQQNFGPGWAPFSYDLSAYTITGNTAVRFIINTNSAFDAYTNDILIDEVSMNNGGCPQFCVPPSLLTSSNIIQNSFDFGWTGNASATSWEINYGLAGIPAGAGQSIFSTTTLNSITGLTLNTSYDVYVRAICSAGDSSSWVGPLNVTTLASCPAPSNLAATNITNNSADLSWAENGSATSWQIEYGTQGFAPGTGTFVLTANNPHSLTGLSDDTEYSYYVRAICAPGDSSLVVGPFNFRTPCSVVHGDVSGDAIAIGTLPYSTTGNSDSCYMDTRGNSSPDVWYQYIVEPCTDSLTISLCGSSFDTYLRVFASDTNTEIFFNDDNSTVCGTTTSSHLVIDVTNESTITPGDTVYILVEGFGANQGAYNLNVSSTIQCFSTDLVISEIMYNPPEGGTDSLEFVEIYNNGTSAVDLTNYTLSGITYTFPAVTLPAGGYYVVGVNASAFNTVYGFAADGIASSGALSNSSEAIMIIDATGLVIDSVDYDDGAPWATSPDGNGPSLILCDVASDNADGNNWSASLTSTGVTINGNLVMASPGAANSCPAPLDVAVASFYNLDSVYCHVTAVTGSAIITNMSTTDATNVAYTVTVGGALVTSGTIALLAGNASDTITVGAFPVVTGMADVVVTTSLMGDVNTTNDTLSMTVYVSNTSTVASMVTPILCNGDSTGVAMAVGSDGIGTYTYLWNANPNLVTPTLMNLPAGMHTVIVMDSVGCSDTAIVTFTEPTAIVLTDSVINVLCNADSTGIVTVLPTGGTGAYSFAWSNGNTTDINTNLTAGSYILTVTDANGCMATLTSTVLEPAAPLDVTITDNGNGTAVATATGGTAGYTFLWDAAAANQTTDTATALINGTYMVTVTDANGCTDTTSAVITFVGLNTLTNLSNLNLFPNPTNANVFVELELINNADVQINITNSIGQLVISQELTNLQSETIELNTSTLGAGIYMVQFTIGSEFFAKKLIISKQ